MNTTATIPSRDASVAPHVEFFRIPRPLERDPHFGMSRAWYYKAESLGEIRMVSVRQRNALRGARLVVYDSVADYIRRCAGGGEPAHGG